MRVCLANFTRGYVLHNIVLANQQLVRSRGVESISGWIKQRFRGSCETVPRAPLVSVRCVAGYGKGLKIISTIPRSGVNRAAAPHASQRTAMAR